MVGRIGLAQQVVVLVVAVGSRASQGVGDAGHAARAIVGCSIGQVQRGQRRLGQIAVGVILHIGSHAHRVGHRCGQAAVIARDARGDAFGLRDTYQIAVGVIGVARRVALGVGDAGQVVHRVIGHRGRQRAVAREGNARHIAHRVIGHVAHVRAVVLNGGGQLRLCIVAVGAIDKQPLLARHAGHHVVAVVGVVVGRRLGARTIHVDRRLGGGRASAIGRGDADAGLCRRHAVHAALGALQTAVGLFILILNVIALGQLDARQQLGGAGHGIVAIDIVGRLPLGVGERAEAVMARCGIGLVAELDAAAYRVADLGQQVGPRQGVLEVE